MSAQTVHASDELKHIVVTDVVGIVDGEENGTEQDLLDMHRLGKKQEFRRNFSFWSTLGFISIYMASWEFVLVSLAIGLTNGGFAGLFWTFLGTVLCYSSVVVSMAEMESMAPTSGGQYHWVSEFAPPSCQRFLSYIAGWMSTLGWLASCASAGFVTAMLLQSMIEIFRTDYLFTNWQFTLIMIAGIALTVILNTWGASSLPMIETVSLFGHVIGFFAIVIPVVVMCPKNSAEDVFTVFVDEGGWGSVGTACLITQVAILYCNLGSDTIVHISEEVKDASFTVPRIMWWSYVYNVALAIGALLTMLFCIGPLEDAIEAESPYLQLFLNTGSKPAAMVLTLILFILIFSGNITAIATTSREIFAFSRDKGLPFSRWLSAMDMKRHIPENAVYFSAVVACLICLINLGSTVGFNIVVSLNLLALMSTYMLSIGCIALKRLRGQPLPHARWSLGKWGLPINIFASLYAAFAVVFSCFPNAQPVEASTANWAPAVWAGVLILSVITYVFYGKRHYTAPVLFVEGKRAGDLQSSR